MRVPKANQEMESRGLDFHTAIRKRDDLSNQLAAAVAAGLDAEVYRAGRECIRLRVLHHIDAHLVTSLGDVLSSGPDQINMRSLKSLLVLCQSPTIQRRGSRLLNTATTQTHKVSS